jgi:hypothetical protein
VAPIHEAQFPDFSKVGSLFSDIAISVVFSRRTNNRAVNALDTAVILKVEKKKFFETRTLNAGLPPREEVVCRKRHSPMAAAA